MASIKQDSERGSIIFEEDSSTSIIREEQVCPIHPGKKIEAFCEKDGSLLCIDCILSEQHRGKEIISIQKAAGKHRQFLKDQ